MGKHPSLFNLIVLIFVSGMILLMYVGIGQMTQKEFYDFRIQQMKAESLYPDENIQPVLQLGPMIASDYFQVEGSNFKYKGGVYGGPWEVGEIYSRNELESSDIPIFESHTFLNFPLPDKGFYINIDRGDEKAVRDFLTVMDPYGQNGIDTLVLDFRFLQAVDFSSILRLFNQLTPQERITLGTIISKHQEEEIKSSGKPFFSVGYTIFLVDSYMPASVKLILERFSKLSSYELRGVFQMDSDSICLYTDYNVGENIYRLCTDKLTGIESKEEPLTRVSTVPASIMKEMIAEVDRLWYKRRDTSGVQEYLLNSFSSLLP